MSRKLWNAILFVMLVLGPAMAHASKTTYVYTDRRFNFVKRVEVDKDVLKERQTNHPYTLSDLQLRDMLVGIRFNKTLVLEKEVQEREVFDQASLDFLIPILVKAFKDVQPNEEIVFSFVTHKSKFLIKDERLTIVRAWVEGNLLHLEFRKLMARLDPNYDKLSDVNQAMNRAQGVRVALEVAPGQQFGKSTNEVLLTIPDAAAMAAASTLQVDQEPKTERAKKATKLEATSSPSTSSVEVRLQQLENLKKKGLINQEEYQQKRQAILNQL